MTLYRQGTIWYYDFTVDGKRHAGSTGETSKAKAQAVQERLRVQFRGGANIKQIWQQTKASLLGRGESVPMEFEPLWKHFLAHSMSQACSRRQSGYRHHIKKFVEWLEKSKGKLTVGEVTPSIATEYMTVVRNEPGAPASKNEHLMALKMLFASFDEDTGVVENPFANIKRLPNRSISREVFTQDELKLIGEKAEGDMLDLCLTALYTGLRRGDICNLRWASVSPDCQWINLTMGKTGLPVSIPVMPRLREHLLSRTRTGEHVYPNLHELYQNHASELSQQVKRFLVEIGISGTRRAVDGYAREMSMKDIHSFRHTFVYLAACNNIPLPVVQSIVGPASPAMTKIYMDHASQADKQRYLSAMPDLFSGDKTAARVPVQNIIAMVESDAPKNEILSALYTLV